VIILLTRPLKKPEVFQFSDVSKMTIARIGTQKKPSVTSNSKVESPFSVVSSKSRKAIGSVHSKN
jgi:hypothetical protein